ncbi:MAG TPA: Ku protein [Drouetiella sp.]|jgi:DNA end-binding protein Ku
MSRSAWTGMFSFGMVNIPSYLVPQDQSQQEVERFKPAFDEIREKNKSKREFKIHQFTQQQHFFKDLSDLKTLAIPAKHVMQIHGFLPSKEIDPVCYDKSFMLFPESGATEPLVLLIDALEEKEFVGIGTIYLRNKPIMLAVQARRGFLLVNTLLYPDQINTGAANDLNKALKEFLEAFEKKVEDAAKHEESARA